MIIGAVLPFNSMAGTPADRVMFIHHSTGQNIILEGALRGFISDLNAQNGTNIEFWDHSQNAYGITNGDGARLYRNYNIPDDNTDPDGLNKLWTTDNAARDSLMANFDTIAFKPCYYPTSYITTDAGLLHYKQMYLEMMDFFDQHPEKTFIIVTPPALHQFRNSLAIAARARNLAEWLACDEFLNGHPNVKTFDYFDLIAEPDENSDMYNMLAYEYERDHDGSDWHPNEAASILAAPVMAEYIYNAMSGSTTSAVPETGSLLKLNKNHPNPFNPSTSIEFSVDKTQSLDIAVFNVQGQRVRQLVSSTFSEGTHQVIWDGRNDRGQMVSSGVYFSRVTPDSGSPVSRKMVLAK